MLRLEGSRQLESCTSYEGYRSTPAYGSCDLARAITSACEISAILRTRHGRVIDEGCSLFYATSIVRTFPEHVEDRKMLDVFGRERPTFVSAKGRHRISSNETRSSETEKGRREGFEGCESASCPIRRLPWYFRTRFAPYRSIRGINRRSREETSREHRVLPI